MKTAFSAVMANTGLVCLATGMVLIIPAFKADAHFWLPAAVAAQIWVCCVRRAGR